MDDPSGSGFPESSTSKLANLTSSGLRCSSCGIRVCIVDKGRIHRLFFWRQWLGLRTCLQRGATRAVKAQQNKQPRDKDALCLGISGLTSSVQLSLHLLSIFNVRKLKSIEEYDTMDNILSYDAKDTAILSSSREKASETYKTPTSILLLRRCLQVH